MSNIGFFFDQFVAIAYEVLEEIGLPDDTLSLGEIALPAADDCADRFGSGVERHQAM